MPAYLIPTRPVIAMSAFPWNFPPEIFRDHVLSFLNLRSLVRLDDAATNHEIRVKVHEVFKRHIHRALGDKKVAEPVLRWIKARFIYLDHIEFHYLLTDEEMGAMGEQLVHMTSMSYRGCNKLNARGVQALVQYPARLQSLELQLCPYITDECVIAITSVHTGLQSLTLEFCKVTTLGVNAILQNCPTLTTLSLTGCRLMISPDLMELPWHRCSRVTSLGLGKLSLLTDAHLEAIVEHMPNLTSLDLSWSANITDHGVVFVTENCPALRRLVLELLSKVTNLSLSALADNSPHLVELNVNWCYKLKTEGFVNFAAHCTRLERLDFTRCEVLDDTVLALAEHCPDLTHLNLYECYKLTDRSVLAVAAQCTKLVDICLINCRALTNASKTAFPTHCRVLTVQP